MNVLSITLVAALVATTIPASADAGHLRDRWDRIEDRIDRRESIIDERVDHGRRHCGAPENQHAETAHIKLAAVIA